MIEPKPANPYDARIAGTIGERGIAERARAIRAGCDPAIDPVAKLRDDLAVKRLFTEIAPSFATRPGGYTRILRLGNRVGDNAETARIELVGLGEYKAD